MQKIKYTKEQILKTIESIYKDWKMTERQYKLLLKKNS